MIAISAILFDWDGTLLDSYPAGFRASMAVFRHFGITVDRDRFLETYSPNWYQTYRMVGLSETDWEAADRIWLATYYRDPPPLYPFAVATLEVLLHNGYTLGLVTSGNRHRVTEELDRHRLRGLFTSLVCFEDTEQKKPHPAPLLAALESMERAPAESAYVGDRPEDILMGRQTGVFTVGVESAYVTREALEAVSPDLIFPNAGHLPSQFGPRRA